MLCYSVLCCCVLCCNVMCCNVCVNHFKNHGAADIQKTNSVRWKNVEGPDNSGPQSPRQRCRTLHGATQSPGGEVRCAISGNPRLASHGVRRCEILGGSTRLDDQRLPLPLRADNMRTMPGSAMRSVQLRSSRLVQRRNVGPASRGPARNKPLEADPIPERPCGWWEPPRSCRDGFLTNGGKQRRDTTTVCHCLRCLMWWTHGRATAGTITRCTARDGTARRRVAVTKTTTRDEARCPADDDRPKRSRRRHMRIRRAQRQGWQEKHQAGAKTCLPTLFINWKWCCRRKTQRHQRVLTGRPGREASPTRTSPSSQTCAANPRLARRKKQHERTEGPPGT